jgi:hypothetical protein
MSADLASLQERYPHGSRWRWRVNSNEPYRTVLGWEPERSASVVWRVEGTHQIVSVSPGTIDSGFDLVVPTPPCPITRPSNAHRDVPLSVLARVVLHPPGAVIDGKRYVVCEDDGDLYVPADREFILGTWDGAS